MQALFGAHARVIEVSAQERQTLDTMQEFERCAADARVKIREVYTQELRPLLEYYQGHGGYWKWRTDQGKAIREDTSDHSDDKVTYLPPQLYVNLWLPKTARRFLPGYGRLTIQFGEHRIIPDGDFKWCLTHRVPPYESPHALKKGDRTDTLYDGFFRYPDDNYKFSSTVGAVAAEISPGHIAKKMEGDRSQAILGLAK